MTVLSPSDLALVKSQPQQQQLFIAIYQPSTLFAARCIDGSVNKGSRIITFGNISAGSPSGVFPNSVLAVGTTPAGNDLGQVRIRYATANTLVVAENSTIAWASGVYLTALNYVDIEAIYPRMIADPNNSNNVIFYKDYDIAYSNQNTILGTFICAGPHRAQFRDPASGIAQLYWSSSGTSNVNGNSTSFSWFFEGAQVTGSSLRDPGWVSYDHAGYFRTTLTVTDNATGAIDTTHRFVSILDRTDSGPIRPLVEWEIHDLNGSRKSAGFSGRFRVWEQVGSNYIHDGALVMVFSDDYYGGTHKNLGGNSENNSQVFWVGYILKGSIIYDYKEGAVEFEVGSVSELMKQAQGFSVSCQADTAPDTWFKIKDMTNQKAIYHYLKWHSTVLSCTDYQYTGDDRSVQYFDASRESIYDSIAKFIETGLKGELVTDRQGKLWAEISADATTNARTAFPVTMQLYNTDWSSNPKTNSVAISSKAAMVSNGPIITERYFPEVSYIEYGGIAYSGPETGTFGAFMACAPGSAPAYKGSVVNMEGMILIDQQGLNQIVGNVYAYNNSQFPEFAFPMAGAYKNMDIAPIEIVQVNLQPSQTPRNITLVNEPFHPIQAEWRYYARQKSIVHTIHLAQLVNGNAGDTIVIPVSPPTAGGGFTMPSISIPSIPAFFPSLGSSVAVTRRHGIFPGQSGDFSVPFLVSPFDATLGDFDYNSGIIPTATSGTYGATMGGVYHIVIAATPSDTTSIGTWRIDVNWEDGMAYLYNSPSMLYETYRLLTAGQVIQPGIYNNSLLGSPGGTFWMVTEYIHG